MNLAMQMARDWLNLESETANPQEEYGDSTENWANELYAMMKGKGGKGGYGKGGYGKGG